MANFALNIIDGVYAMSRSRLTLITAFLLMIVAGCCTAEVHQHAHEEELLQMHASHVHGEVIFNIVLEDDHLDVEMISPAMNITGFEHAPSTEQERQAVEEAVRKLGDAGNLLMLPETAGCKPGAATIETPLREEHADHDHGHEQAAEPEDEGEHAEFHVTHSLQCDKSGAIDSVTLTLFRHFPGVEKVRLQWIHGQRQGAAIVEPGNPAVTFE
jgi:hypothetical protein